MSYILLALKRSQVDRDVEQALARGAARSSSASARRFLWPWLIGGGLAINALVIGAVFMATRQPALDVAEPSPPPAPVTTAETPKAVEEVKPPTAPAPGESAAKEPPPAAPTSTVPAATMPAEAKPAPTNGTPSDTQRGSRRSRLAEAKDGETQALQAPAASAPRPDAALALVQPPGPVRPPVPSPARPSSPESAIVPRQPAPPDVPMEPSSRHRRRRAHLGEPTERAQPIPMQPTPAPGAEMELKIEVLVWASDPKLRMVYMNGLKYVEGQRLENGAILEQIVEDGIVVVQNGRRVRVRSDSR
jgi:hypothetical protein